jgi:AraC-like DNA-binding protein
MIIAFSKTKGKVAPLDFHSHEYYEVYVFHGGDCSYLIDNQIINLVPGMILLMNGKSIHKAHVTKNEDEYERSVLHFKPDIVRKTMEKLKCSVLLEPFKENAVSIQRVNNKENLEKIARIIADLNQLSSMEETNKINKEVQLGIIKLLMFIDRASKPVRPEDSTTQNVKKYYIEEVVLYLQNNFSKAITIEKISNELGLSPSYLSRIFKETTGHTIMEYLMYYRFTQAKYLIEISENNTFKEIASACGFQSSSHFSRFIKERTGMAPTVFREAIQKESYISPNSR